MAVTIMQHPDKDVREAIGKLCDALCMWERESGRNSILILREQGDFAYRAMSGKPVIPDDTEDSFLLENYNS